MRSFTLLKRLFTILFFLTCVSLVSYGQNKNTPGTDDAAKIVRFYPNPATSVINFEFQSGYDRSYTFQLYNFMGKKVNEFKPNSQRMNLSLEGYYRGVYIYQLRDKNGKIIESGKFQVVR